MAKINRVLFICAGNTCRSPFAHFFANWLKKNEFKEQLKGVEFDSAGIYHYYKTAQPETIKYLMLKGIDITNFRTKKIDADLIKKHDLILGFEQKHHINKLKRKFKNISELSNKCFLLLEFAGETENLEIEDPFHLEQENYFKILKRIEEGVIKTIKKIIKMNQFEESRN